MEHCVHDGINGINNCEGGPYFFSSTTLQLYSSCYGWNVQYYYDFASYCINYNWIELPTSMDTRLKYKNIIYVFRKFLIQKKKKISAVFVRSVVLHVTFKDEKITIRQYSEFKICLFLKLLLLVNVNNIL